MKKYFIPVASAMLLLSGCNVLDKEPLTTIAPSNFFKSATDAEASLTAAYDGLQSKGCYAEVLNLVGNMPSDDCTSNNNDVRALDDINWNSSTGQVGDAYRDNYRTINRANAVIKYVPGVAGMNATRRDQILGEARFLRALSYFNLVRLYGAVPLRLEPTETGDPAVLNLPRAATDQVYARIVEDLTVGAGLMADVNPARATKGAANALLARVQLTQRNWAAAKDAANLVLSGKGGYSLQGFNSLFPADNKGESIFEIQFSGSADGGTSFTLPDLLLPLPAATYSFAKFNLPTLFVSGSAARPTDLTSVVDTINDQRWSYQGSVNVGRSHASYVQGRGPGANDRGPFVYKWRSDGSGFNSSDNYYVLRLAEVYLAAAEASNELNNPAQAVLDYLNPIRQRAGLPALTPASPEAASQATLRTEIDKQRRLELAFEGERWFDLLRYARHTQANSAVQHAVTALDVIAQKRGTRDVNYLLFPIPLGELNTNTQLQQNPGY
ncbi:RagB/SusD family nutrient uptake outer membrane protein [Hymenobacter terrigena]